MAIVQACIDKVEKFNQITDNDSRQVNAPTIEGLLDLMIRLPELIGKLTFTTLITFIVKVIHINLSFL